MQDGIWWSHMFNSYSPDRAVPGVSKYILVDANVYLSLKKVGSVTSSNMCSVSVGRWVCNKWNDVLDDKLPAL